LPKLDIEGDNWVMYRDRLLWTMKQFSMKDHIANDSPPAAYTAKGTVGSLTPTDRWEREDVTLQAGRVVRRGHVGFTKAMTRVLGFWIVVGDRGPLRDVGRH